MFWADEIVDEILKTYPGKDEFVLRDEKTPSGRVHIGSLRGFVIHSVIAQALNERGKKARFIWEFNDADPMDGLPIYLDASKYREYMGKPLKDVPSPHDELGGKRAKNYAEYFAREFLGVINSLGFEPEIIYSSHLYKKGHYDKWIAKVLDHKDEILAIYREVSGSEKPSDWYPLQVVCEKCGRVGTTKVVSWDSASGTVGYECLPDLVDWAVGCGHKGECSPFGGRGKLPWKVEWPVKWSSMNVDIEGAGKDHNAAGGSHEIGERICRECLEMPVPFNIPYEFFLFGGAKMSSSKGKGASVTEVAETIPPELLRFLMVRKRPNHPIDFDPFGPTIPILFDEHDKAAAYYFGEAEGEFPDMKRVFHFSQVGGAAAGKGGKAGASGGRTCGRGADASGKVKAHFYPRFTRVAFFEQIPHTDIFDEMQKIKGKKLTKEDKAEIELRKHYAKLWLEKFAPDAYKFTVQAEMPEMALALSDGQKEFLDKIVNILAEKDWSGEELHSKIHELKEASPLSPKEAFGAIYIALLGKDSGPQAGWFLEALDKKFLIKRFREVCKSKMSVKKEKKAPIKRIKNDYFHLSGKAYNEYPEVQIAFAIIEGIKVGESSAELKSLLKSAVGSAETAHEKLNSFKVLEGYRAIFKRMKVDMTKRKPTSCALFERIAKGKGLYEINNVVDVCNYMTLQDGISFGAFDFDHVKFPVAFDIMKGGEEFWAFGDKKVTKVAAGEFCMKDSEGKLLNRDYNYKDSEYTKILPDTKGIFLTMDSLDPMPIADAEKKLDKSIETFIKYCGGKVKFKLVA